MDGEPILKKTLVTMAAMVGACVAFVGTLSVVAVFAVTHAVSGGGSGSGAGAAPGAIDAPAATHAPSSWSSSGKGGGAKASTKTSQEICSARQQPARAASEDRAIQKCERENERTKNK